MTRQVIDPALEIMTFYTWWCRKGFEKLLDKGIALSQSFMPHPVSGFLIENLLRYWLVWMRMETVKYRYFFFLSLEVTVSCNQADGPCIPEFVVLFSS